MVIRERSKNAEKANLGDIDSPISLRGLPAIMAAFDGSFLPCQFSVQRFSPSLSRLPSRPPVSARHVIDVDVLLTNRTSCVFQRDSPPRCRNCSKSCRQRSLQTICEAFLVWMKKTTLKRPAPVVSSVLRETSVDTDNRE